MIIFNGLEPAGIDEKIGDETLAELWRVRADFAISNETLYVPKYLGL